MGQQIQASRVRPRTQRKESREVAHWLPVSAVGRRDRRPTPAVVLKSVNSGRRVAQLRSQNPISIRKLPSGPKAQSPKPKAQSPKPKAQSLYLVPLEC